MQEFSNRRHPEHPTSEPQIPTFPTPFISTTPGSFARINQLEEAAGTRVMLADLHNALLFFRDGYLQVAEHGRSGFGDLYRRMNMALPVFGFLAPYASTDHGMRLGGSIRVQGEPHEVCERFQETFKMSISQEVVVAARAIVEGYKAISNIFSMELTPDATLASASITAFIGTKDTVQKHGDLAMTESANQVIRGIDQFISLTKNHLTDEFLEYQQAMQAELPSFKKCPIL